MKRSLYSMLLTSYILFAFGCASKQTDKPAIPKLVILSSPTPLYYPPFWKAAETGDSDSHAQGGEEQGEVTNLVPSENIALDEQKHDQ